MPWCKRQNNFPGNIMAYKKIKHYFSFADIAINLRKWANFFVDVLFFQLIEFLLFCNSEISTV